MGGMLYTLDRLAFLAKLPGRKPHAVIYGGARVRTETKDLNMQLGRVESTIAGASPSLLDEIAHDAIVWLFALAAHEAIAHDKYPADYYGRRFPHLRQWQERKKITDAFNAHGAEHKDVHELIRQCLNFLDSMHLKYPALGAMIDFVMARVKNLQTQPVQDLDRYRETPHGAISEVMMAMHDRGDTPLGIMKKAYEYQQWVAQEIEPMTQSPRFFEMLNERFLIPTR
jgi:hypothetical protein